MILLISSVFPPEPVVSATMVYELAVELSKNWDVMVLTPRPSRPFGFTFSSASKANLKFQHQVLNSFTYPKSRMIGRMMESFSFGKHAVKYIKRNWQRIDCIYLNTWPLLAQSLIVKTSKKYSIPSVIHVQDIYPESISKRMNIFGNLIKMLLLPIDKYTLKNVSKIVTISNKMSTLLTRTRHISNSKFEMVRNWQNESEFISFKKLKAFRNVKQIDERPFVFMFVGNIGPVAGVDFIIKCFAKANLRNTLLIIAGSGSSKANCIKIAESYKNSRIEFWDIPAGRVPEIQEKADVMLLNVKKGFSSSSVPSKLPAYMFSEKPILASLDEESDTALAIKQANCGWVVPPEDTGAFCKTMELVVSMPKEVLSHLAANGFNYALNNFSQEINLKKLVNIINETAKYLSKPD